MEEKKDEAHVEASEPPKDEAPAEGKKDESEAPVEEKNDEP